MTDATAFLKSTRPAAGPALPIALGAGVARGVLVVAFAWVLSGVVDAAVFGGVELTALAGRMELLIALRSSAPGSAGSPIKPPSRPPLACGRPSFTTCSITSAPSGRFG